MRQLVERKQDQAPKPKHRYMFKKVMDMALRITQPNDAETLYSIGSV